MDGVLRDPVRVQFLVVFYRKSFCLDTVLPFLCF